MFSRCMSIALIFLGIVVFVLQVKAAAPNTLTGWATAVTGDTIRLQRRIVRLWGVDAPEFNQHCEDPNGKPFLCGDEAHSALSELVKQDRVVCIDIAPEAQGASLSAERRRRYVATCYIGDINLNATLVRKGWALAYEPETLEFMNQQRLAQRDKAGLWTRIFQKPWVWRANMAKQKR